jgi:PAT family beta-lactamase induction signal transducer AmpG
MLALGVSAGIPFPLIFSTLSLWLREAGVERGAVTFFSWAALAYSFKFVWAPLVDAMPLPWLSKRFGRRRGWLLLAQVGVLAAICLLAVTDPAKGQASLTLMALFAVMLGFFAATQDVVIDAYRIERAGTHMQALMSSVYIAGYRLGMVIAGAGSLILTQTVAEAGGRHGGYSFFAWRFTYLTMATIMLLGLATTLLVAEPEKISASPENRHPPGFYGRLLVALLLAGAVFAMIFFRLMPMLAITGGWRETGRLALALSGALLTLVALTRFSFINRRMFKEAYLLPIADFFRNYGNQAAVKILLLIGLYRLSDIVMGVVANVFYLDLGFSKGEIAYISKTFGLVMTILGGFCGGTLCLRFGVMPIMFLGAALAAVANLLFALLAHIGHDTLFLTLAIAADNLAAGLAAAAFVAFLSGLTSRAFTAVQYAIFSSLMSLIPKFTGGYSGKMVTALGYEGFFMLTAAMSLPVLLLVWWNRHATTRRNEPGA